MLKIYYSPFVSTQSQISNPFNEEYFRVAKFSIKDKGNLIELSNDSTLKVEFKRNLLTLGHISASIMNSFLLKRLTFCCHLQVQCWLKEHSLDISLLKTNTVINRMQLRIQDYTLHQSNLISKNCLPQRKLKDLTE